MKQIMLFAVSCVALAACTKESDIQMSGNHFEAGQVVTLSVNADNGTKVTSSMSGNTINFLWEQGDKIVVKVGADTAHFKLSTGAGTASATFTGKMPAAGNNFKVQFPVSDPDLNNQQYSDGNVIPHNMMMMKPNNDADVTLNGGFSLEPQYALLGFNLHGSDTVGKIVVTNTSSTAETKPSSTLKMPVGGLQLVDGETNAKKIFIVMEPGSYKFKAEVFDNSEEPKLICEYETTEAQEIGAGTAPDMPAKEVKKMAPVENNGASFKQYQDGEFSWQ